MRLAIDVMNPATTLCQNAILWLISYKNESLDWYEIKADDVKKIIEINSAGKSISKLEDYSIIRESKNEKAFV